MLLPEFKKATRVFEPSGPLLLFCLGVRTSVFSSVIGLAAVAGRGVRETSTQGRGVPSDSSELSRDASSLLTLSLSDCAGESA